MILGVASVEASSAMITSTGNSVLWAAKPSRASRMYSSWL
ncbi:Uncharacterised protein [Mycobacterium tuberculosis]|uniref:Uncharacterized protein n=1 Tax=Mycobacterium tuberculosis TaxID=1773 RepID=A0A916P9G4_MYCTX|nr:Uncharacterised protein [Mycobacterium tuberculosis]